MTASVSVTPTPPTPSLAITPPVPERLTGLAQLANNLAWSWNRDARALFREIDDTLWNRLHHNPVVLLQQVDPARLELLANDTAFCARYDRAMQWLATEKSDEHTWYSRTFPELREIGRAHV